MTEIMWSNGKAYAFCNDCNKLVRLNKGMFGSLHICVGEDK